MYYLQDIIGGRSVKMGANRIKKNKKMSSLKKNDIIIKWHPLNIYS